MRAVEGAGPRTSVGDPLVVDRASGATLIDPDGNAFTDLAASFAAATIGHSHPDVTAAVAAQIGVASHVSTAAVSEQRVAFEEDLVAIAPTGLDRVLLGISGADANDTALKLARTMTGRREVLAFSGGYFGRAGGVVGVNGKAAFRTSVGRDPEAHFLPYPDAYRWPVELGGPALACEGALALVRSALEDPGSGVGPLAAIIMEPAQGNGGVIIPPDGFLQGLRALCDEHGVPLIFDEIQCGFGRTGRLWASEHTGVVPDLMTVGKGIGGGLALSAVVGRASVDGPLAGGYAHVDVPGQRRQPGGGSRRDRRDARRPIVGALRAARRRLLEQLATGLADDPRVGDIRGLGLFIGIELVIDRDRAPRTRPGPRAVRRAAFDRGVVLGVGGSLRERHEVCPPLTIEESLLDAALDLTIDTIRGTR